MAKDLLDITGTDGESPAFLVTLSDIPFSLRSMGIQGAETVDIQYAVRSRDEAGEWMDYFRKPPGGSGEQVQLLAGNNAVTLDAPGLYKLNVPSAVAGTVVVTGESAKGPIDYEGKWDPTV